MLETMKLYQFHCKELKKNGLALTELNDYSNFKDIMSLEEFKEVILEKQRRKNKRYRTKQKYYELIKIRNILNDNCKIVFGTITLNNHYLNLKEDTYIRNIHKWLKSHFIYSILNKDYGGKTEREHYHFIALTNEELIDTNVKSRKGNPLHKLTKQDYFMGHEPTLEIINMTEEDVDNTVNYLLKLNNHSNKIGTKSRVRIIKSAAAKMTILMNGLEESKGERKFKNFVKEFVR